MVLSPCGNACFSVLRADTSELSSVTIIRLQTIYSLLTQQPCVIYFGERVSFQRLEQAASERLDEPRPERSPAAQGSDSSASQGGAERSFPGLAD